MSEREEALLALLGDFKAGSITFRQAVEEIEQIVAFNAAPPAPGAAAPATPGEEMVEHFAHRLDALWESALATGLDDLAVCRCVIREIFAELAGAPGRAAPTDEEPSEYRDPIVANRVAVALDYAIAGLRTNLNAFRPQSPAWTDADATALLRNALNQLRAGDAPPKESQP